MRFTSPSLGGQRETFLEQGQWQVGLAYRRLYAHRWFIGSQENLAGSPLPFHEQLYLNINSLDVSIAYGISRRLSLTLTLPFQYATHSRFYADTARHTASARGLGDVNLVASYWLRDPDNVPTGNLALALGVKSPSGNSRYKDNWFNADHSVTRREVDQAVQPGDGAWGLMVQAVGYQRLSPRISAYLVGSYLVSTRETTTVAGPRGHLAVPDIYLFRLGLAFGLAPSRGLTGALGLRIDGIPQGDIIGGRDLGFRRPGYSLYLDPTLALRRGPSEWTLSVPLRVHQNFQRSDLDRQTGYAGGGDLADFLVFAGYSHRF